MRCFIEQMDIVNGCSRTISAVVEAFNARDIEAMGRLFAADFVRVDRRPGLRSEANGWEEMATNLHAWMELGWHCVVTPLVVRGNRLALHKFTFRDPNDFEIEYLTVNECGSDGRVTFGANHETDDLNAALAELDERFDRKAP